MSKAKKSTQEKPCDKASTRPEQAWKTVHNPGSPDDQGAWMLICGCIIQVVLLVFERRLGVSVASGVSGFVFAYWKAARWLLVTTPIAALISSLFGLALGLATYQIMAP